ncbi:hypothetical protein [Bradyrhizobium vignae]|uniref:Uncharacterized protein n=1 Tax=Bradyrhizobium vignae TaxID=1549949 RepID=A0ABS3ZRG2_9BRAD|nr:hypothetical protein [Bradyrhizobium vignae]MBP0110355.1 hypothetical protein [Bradyrhizobium vignae]
MSIDGRCLVIGAALRVPLVLLALAGVLWCSVAQASFWLRREGRDISAGILIDDRFKRGILEDALARIEAYPEQPVVHPDVVRTEALVYLRVAEEATKRNGFDVVARNVQLVDQKVRTALVLNPADSFLWLMRYSAENERSGFDVRHLGYLDQSYAAGPREGWIALRRNRLAVAIFSILSETMRQRAASEFAELVAAGFIAEAALNLMSVGSEYRSLLLTSLEPVDVISREAFARYLLREGAKANVPGIELDERLWR